MGFKDEGLIDRAIFLLESLERLRSNPVKYADELENATFALASYTKTFSPARESLRVIFREVILLGLGQVEAYAIPSIAKKRFDLLMRLLIFEPEAQGGLGIIKGNIDKKETEQIWNSVIQDLIRQELIIVDSGSLCISKEGSDFVCDELIPCINAVDHKWLDRTTDKINFWLISVLEFERQIELYFESRKVRTGDSLTRFISMGEESLYSQLREKVASLLEEYSQAQRPFDATRRIPTLSEKEKSASRIQRDLEDLSRFSRKLGNGVTRLAFSKEETDAMLWAKQRLSELGFDCKFDAFMNLHAYDPRDNEQRILVGTHVDSVIDGGRYDGIVGLVSFLEALRLAKEQGKSFVVPVDFVIFRAEESTVFKVALLGSKVAAGFLDANDLQNIRFNRDQELKQNLAHYYPEYEDLEIKPATLFDVLSKNTDAFPNDAKKGCWLFDYPKRAYKAYFEIHIEQGIVLESQRVDFGIVHSFRAPIREIITIEGRANHSGTTPMGHKYRKDALCAAAECIQAIETIATSEMAARIDVVGTVGELGISGMGINKIPGKCSFTLDLRSKDLENRTRIHAKIHEVLFEICQRRDVRLDIEQTESSAPVSVENDVASRMLRKLLGKIIKRLGYDYLEMPSGAGHDAMTMARVGIPTCMLFIPCKAGISHSADEKAENTDIAKAARVLLEAICNYKFAEITEKGRTLDSYSSETSEAKVTETSSDVKRRESGKNDTDANRKISNASGEDRE